MPWVSATKRSPAHYQLPRIERAISPTERDVEIALIERKKLVQLRDELLATQKRLGPQDRELAVFLGREAKDIQKQYRGMCNLIAWIAGSPPGDCKRDGMSEELAPYADDAWTMFGNEWRVLSL